MIEVSVDCSLSIWPKSDFLLPLLHPAHFFSFILCDALQLSTPTSQYRARQFTTRSKCHKTAIRGGFYFTNASQHVWWHSSCLHHPHEQWVKFIRVRWGCHRWHDLRRPGIFPVLCRTHVQKVFYEAPTCLKLIFEWAVLHRLWSLTQFFAFDDYSNWYKLIYSAYVLLLRHPTFFSSSSPHLLLHPAHSFSFIYNCRNFIASNYFSIFTFRLRSGFVRWLLLRVRRSVGGLIPPPSTIKPSGSPSFTCQYLLVKCWVCDWNCCTHCHMHPQAFWWNN